MRLRRALSRLTVPSTTPGRHAVRTLRRSEKELLEALSSRPATVRDEVLEMASRIG